MEAIENIQSLITQVQKFSINMSLDIWSSTPEEIAKQIESGFIGASRVGDDKWLGKVPVFPYKFNTTL